MMIIKETIWAGRRWVEVALFLFVVGLLLGLTVAQTDPEEVLRALQPVLSQIGGIGEQVTAADSPWARAWIIFQRNAQVTLFMTALALPLAGVMPVLFMLVNGLLLGIVIGLSSRLAGGLTSPMQMFLALAPHGVLELPALWLSAGFAMRLGVAWLLPNASGHRLQTLRRTAVDALTILSIVLVLLLVAAFIEGNITLALVRRARPV